MPRRPGYSRSVLYYIYIVIVLYYIYFAIIIIFNLDFSQIA
jgi:hypothetical protein